MIEQLARGMNIYYRGYVVHENIRHIHYTIYGARPQREELASVGSSQEAMRWIDRDIAARGAETLVVWSTLLPHAPVPTIAAI